MRNKKKHPIALTIEHRLGQHHFCLLLQLLRLLLLLLTFRFDSVCLRPVFLTTRPIVFFKLNNNLMIVKGKLKFVNKLLVKNTSEAEYVSNYFSRSNSPSSIFIYIGCR